MSFIKAFLVIFSHVINQGRKSSLSRNLVSLEAVKDSGLLSNNVR